jgi:hypothetical protein
MSDNANARESILERYRRGGELLAAVTTGSAGVELDFRAEGIDLSIRETVWHLADHEAVFRVHLCRTLAGESAALEPVDARRWAEALQYQKRKLSIGVELFRTLRAQNFEMLKELPEGAWASSALNLTEILRHAADHTESLALSIRELRQGYKAAKQAAMAPQT